MSSDTDLFSNIKVGIREAVAILERLGYDSYHISPDEFSDYMTGGTPTGDPITLRDVINCEFLLVHEVVEISELKKMNVPINEQTVMMYYPKVYEAHITALDYELSYFLDKGDIESIRRSLANPRFEENLNDPYLPLEFDYLKKELEPRFRSIVEKHSRVANECEISPTPAQHKMTIQDYYSKRANDYDKQKARTWKSSEGFSEKITNEIVEVAFGKNKGVAIEAGVGSGRISQLLAGKTDLFVLGVDLSKSMLNLAKGKTRHSYSRTGLLLADFEFLPFIDRVADILFCISALHYSDSTPLVIRGFSRVLKDRGVLLIGDLSLHELDADRFLDRLEKAMSPVHGKYYKPSEITRELEKNGFHITHSSTICYRKSFESLIEDKVNYFGTLHSFRQLIAEATERQRKLYDIREEELELRFLMLEATKRE